ncbi:Putative peptidyl-prolyl cis-trans isomerase OS=Tsukamurella paurometabola (strain ATCC 8368 / DSM / CCUG 35730 / CIP 100753 / JCM 10117 / KCTC 9821 / NBRC 16120 / NCIMB 702349 / NCTC 13040) OX=521096 GN=Tpau_1948 PE=4 SV=1 [Tsukamurella paurometabola]|uniref:Putative peptidyl-prolyl cis-trans isomerase n=1 Tax=Tsukamurella paurometabola (strain ATCC 8368 / DSM 20162 / CCUG 35730 / CIP 100753 / JCM 10117 / KCTC 9821 / NBRC 16120 / NCIMB 702349 / NCTC 13040) TaxID=521096 RepID=D5UNJ2_TSUPD|nr:peptidylprolyl isomerase [Tsukamurella paurometabola]ADG78560.1 putative peptidyl-prolyl cis-trans isomerase [Tsukamurella paurometabola DSM 20162]SUP32187.1 Cyclophilin type peptidyl-prolyl cis-trans isomerase/CLD [Tsukamurella paurometabola]
MPSNEERRQAARDKLARQNERREAEARKRKITAIGISAAVVVALVAAGCYIWLPQGPRAPLRVGAENRYKSLHTQCTYPDRPDQATTLRDNIKTTRDQIAKQRAQMGALPPEQRTATEAQIKQTEDQIAEVEAILPALDKAADRNKSVAKPDGKDVPNTGTLAGSIATNQGTIGFEFDRSKAPCNVQAFITMINAKYFDNTICHRETATPGADKKSGLYVLQCGDPSGTGSSGPLWTSPDETPTFLQGAAAPSQPGMPPTVIYPAGTIAVANANSPQSGQSNTGANQFFLVYQDTTLPANYSVIGNTTPDGLKVLQAIAKKGIKPKPGAPAPKPGEPVTDGAPADPGVNITSMVLNS